jgi:hypothetical protein
MVNYLPGLIPTGTNAIVAGLDIARPPKPVLQVSI